MRSHRWKMVNDFWKDVLQEKTLDFSKAEDGGTRRHIPEDCNLRQHHCENVGRLWIA